MENTFISCRAVQIGEKYDFKDIKYNLCRVPFEIDKRTFGNVELVFDASKINKSVAFPRISPNGKFLVLTLFDYGCFPIWHKEAIFIQLISKTLKPTGWILTVITATVIIPGHQIANG